MIFARFDTEALTRVRFAISPMLEAARSVRALDDPAKYALHLPWAEQTRPRIEGLDLSMLRAMHLKEVYNPDFVNPPPTGPLVEFEEELATMIATPASQIRAEVQRARAERQVAVPDPRALGLEVEADVLADVQVAVKEEAAEQVGARVVGHGGALDAPVEVAEVLEPLADLAAEAGPDGAVLGERDVLDRVEEVAGVALPEHRPVFL